MSNSEKKYAEQVDRVMSEYKPRIVELIKKFVALCKEAGLHAEGVDEYTDDEYVWGCGVRLRAEDVGRVDNAVDVRWTLCESARRDGSLEGISFSVEAVHASGRMAGGLIPYNYSDRVWVDLFDADAVEQRFLIISRADLEELVELCRVSLEAEAARLHPKEASDADTHD